MDRLFELFRGIGAPKPDRTKETLLRIVANAQADGIYLDLTDFGFDPRTRRATSISPTAIKELITKGENSGVIRPRDLDFLAQFEAQLTQNIR